MPSANKKNKRGSIPSNSSVALVSPKKELIERTPENDYGVLSDPDEQSTNTNTIPPSSCETTPLPTNHETEPSAKKNSPCLSSSISHNLPSSPRHHLAADSSALECIDNQDELLPLSHSSQHSSPESSPLSQDRPLSIQPPISQSPTSNKSLETLKLKLLKDKNFSRKITLHTFFSYVILAMEIQRSCSASIAQLSVKSVQELVVYMIENHSSSNPVRIYLHTLVDTGIVTNIIESIIDFNKDNKNSSVESLYTLEENELEMFILQSTNTTAQSPATTTANTAATATTTTTAATAVNDVKVDDTTEKPENLPQTPQKCGFFKRMRCCLFSGCCG